MVIQAQLYSQNLVGHHQDLSMEGTNAYGFNFIAQQQLQQQQLVQFDQFHGHKMHTFLVDNNVVNDHHQSRSISLLNEQQRIEIDRFITLQNERLRLALQEQRKQQMSLLVNKYESKAQILLKQKEEEISKAAKKTRELEDYLRRMEIENQTWQRVAREKEAMVVSLNSTIERLREDAILSSNGADDAASCCHNGEEEKGRICKSCNSRNSCMIMIPCRHLSCCKDCEASLDFCPVCRTVKKASIEAFI